jgi:hypothetical protein
MTKHSIGLIVVAAGLLRVEPAWAVAKLFYPNSGYCRSLNYASDVRHCRENRGMACRKRYVCPPGTCSRDGTRDACYLNHCAAENCRH